MGFYKLYLLFIMISIELSLSSNGDLYSLTDNQWTAKFQ